MSNQLSKAMPSPRKSSDSGGEQSQESGKSSSLGGSPKTVEEGDEILTPRESSSRSEPESSESESSQVSLRVDKPKAVVVKRPQLPTSWSAVLPKGIDTDTWTAGDKKAIATLLLGEVDTRISSGVSPHLGKLTQMLSSELVTAALDETLAVRNAGTDKELETLLAKTPPARWSHVTTALNDTARLEKVCASTTNPEAFKAAMSGLYFDVKFAGTWSIAALQHAFAAFRKVPRTHLSNIKKLLTVNGVPSWNKDGTVSLNKDYTPKTYGTKDSELRGKKADDIGKAVLMKRSEYSKRIKSSNLWDVMALHEIGHAVDDRKAIMDSEGSAESNGGWQEYSSAEAVATKLMALGPSGAPDWTKEEVVKVIVNNKPLSTIATERKVKVSALPVHLKMAERCSEVSGRWADERTAMRAIANSFGGNIFHQSYANQWTSFLVDAKNTGVSHYQFRAQGEWFAELYAFEFSGKLDGHPRQAWVKAKVKDDQPQLPPSLPPSLVEEVQSSEESTPSEPSSSPSPLVDDLHKK